MTPELSPALAAPALPDLRTASLGPPDAGGLSARDAARAGAADDHVEVARAGREHGFRRLVSVLGDIVGLVAVASAFPIAILAIGIPIALLVRLVMWLVGAV